MDTLVNHVETYLGLYILLVVVLLAAGTILVISLYLLANLEQMKHLGRNGHSVVLLRQLSLTLALVTLSLGIGATSAIFVVVPVLVFAV